MIKMWGRNTSSNVQKAMFAVGELGLACERIDVGGSFGKNREAAYLAMNPNGLVPTLEEDGFLLWESNSIIRYLAAKFGAGKLEPADPRTRAKANQWMDWQLSVMGPAITPVFWGMIRTPPAERNHKAIDEGKVKTTAAVKMLDEQFAKTRVCRGRSLLDGRHPDRHHELPLPRAGAGAPGLSELRALVRRDRRAAGVQGARLQHSADVRPVRFT